MGRRLASISTFDSEFRARVALEFFRVARESAIGAVLTVVVVILTHWSAQPGSQLLAWVVVVCLPLVVRAVSAQLYLSASEQVRANRYHWFYAAQ
jgi:predicted DCC family thiol-disulfide oxidoreductase YuxK